ncbi:glycosyltransferase family 1 protein [Gracilibacillus timonensis]|uniref:glycosyltransferase family 1 protein n=1 Tax=Gracilibacillus timonensis TaxID=1816696 RepID=UPI000826F592|nr:glycosyltransferase family 1 protein [Gracilibacillus timonensis]
MGSPLRVLHVVVNMNRGGAETLLMNIYQNIDREKIQFDFLTCKEGVFDKEIEALGGEVHRIPYLTEAGHSGYLQALDHFFAEHKTYQIVHAHMDKMSGLVMRSAKKSGIPVRIAHSHNTRSEGHFLIKLYKWYAGLLISSNTTQQYACSQAAAEWLFRSKSQHTFIVNNGINIEQFTYSEQKRRLMRERFAIADDTLVLGHVGRFHPQKNHTFLIELFHQVSKEITNTLLILVGNGPDRTKMETKVKDLKLERKVKFLGVRDDIPDLLQMFDLFVFPSFFEGLPVTLIEAQTAGLPCIISDSITEEVDMDLGLVHRLPLVDQASWTRKMIDITNQPVSRILAKRGVLTEDFDIQKIAQTLQQHYLTTKGGVL